MASTFLILVGGYSTYIYTLLFNPSNSSLTSLAQSDGGLGPSWLSQHPSDPTIVYASQEAFTHPGMIYSFVLDRTSGNLTSKSSVDTRCADNLGASVYIEAINNGTSLMATNYFSGSVFTVDLESDKTTFSNSTQLVTFTGRGPFPQQDSSHPHQV